MKYIVKEHFEDKNTHEIYEVDSLYETDSQERADELRKGGYLGDEVENSVASVLDQNVAEVAAAITSDSHSIEQLEELLKLEEAGENRKGVKKHIESLLKEADGEDGAPEED
ncbi:hypothetical protein [Bacillus sp. T33-2]|uniref:hypothetical protein n=1 Tax=Bacillus sp. T33-2 TaxID=2054168 RepID=UPI000C770823|nr:hypothetical protein [Bacillus sp. T33-2]PLR93194.1 hypothetical protein CVD19_19505 [Bacillus sp. T33-2]